MHAILDPMHHMTFSFYGSPSDRPIGDPYVRTAHLEEMVLHWEHSSKDNYRAEEIVL